MRPFKLGDFDELHLAVEDFKATVRDDLILPVVRFVEYEIVYRLIRWFKIIGGQR